MPFNIKLSKVFSPCSKWLAALSFAPSPVTSSQWLVQPYRAYFNNKWQISWRMKQRLPLTGSAHHVAGEGLVAAPHRGLPSLPAAGSCPVRSAGGRWWPPATQHAACRRAPAHALVPRPLGIGHKMRWLYWNRFSCEMQAGFFSSLVGFY